MKEQVEAHPVHELDCGLCIFYSVFIDSLFHLVSAMGAGDTWMSV